jgi:anti-anti-sigma regulatory factor
MHISTDEVQGKEHVAIMRIQGDVDAANFQRVIARAKQAHGRGTRALLIDLSEVPHMASSGLVALHSVALLMRGEAPPDPKAGWGALRSIDREREAGLQHQVKLLNPQPRVKRVLEMAGFDRFFQIFTDQEAAIASF